ncbi:MAG TPA: O-antigen ligase family protein [Candidatus Acidoferrales bacterium]|nr:O-antigen ligase family protein [Candidatus Acidoferrales bacterium]
MSPDLSPSLLAPFIALVAVLALRAPLYWLLMLDLALVVLPGEWMISRVHLDFTDILLVGIVLGIVLRPAERKTVLQWRRPHSLSSLALIVAFTFAWLAVLLLRMQGGARPGERADLSNLFLTGIGIQLLIEAWRWRLPYRWVWLGLGIFMSVAYVSAPINREYLEGPLSTIYQVYRYCWRQLLYYPLALLLLRNRRQVETAFIVFVLVGTACSLMGFSQGFAGLEATGPFATKNGLGGALIMPFLFSVAGLFHVEAPWPWRLHVVCALIIARGLLFAGSRGAFVAVLCGFVYFMGWMLVRPRSRALAMRFGAVTMLMVVLTLAVRPNIMERPNIQHLLTTSKGTDDDNMRWRMQERWPYFWHKIMDNPWLGVGTDMDTLLGDSAITPHNGYLGVAVVSGLPAMLLLVSLALATFWNGMRLFRRKLPYWQQITGLAIAATLVGLLVHNMVDQTFKLAFAVKVLWILSASAAQLMFRPQAFSGVGIYGGATAARAKRRDLLPVAAAQTVAPQPVARQTRT